MRAISLKIHKKYTKHRQMWWENLLRQKSVLAVKKLRILLKLYSISPQERMLLCIALSTTYLPYSAADKKTQIIKSRPKRYKPGDSKAKRHDVWSVAKCRYFTKNVRSLYSEREALRFSLRQLHWRKHVFLKYVPKIDRTAEIFNRTRTLKYMAYKGEEEILDQILYEELLERAAEDPTFSFRFADESYYMPDEPEEEEDEEPEEFDYIANWEPRPSFLERTAAEYLTYHFPKNERLDCLQLLWETFPVETYEDEFLEDHPDCIDAEDWQPQHWGFTDEPTSDIFSSANVLVPLLQHTLASDLHRIKISKTFIPKLQAAKYSVNPRLFSSYERKYKKLKIKALAARKRRSRKKAANKRPGTKKRST